VILSTLEDITRGFLFDGCHLRGNYGGPDFAFLDVDHGRDLRLLSHLRRQFLLTRTQIKGLYGVEPIRHLLGHGSNVTHGGLSLGSRNTGRGSPASLQFR